MIPYHFNVIRTPWATESFTPTGRPCIATIEPKDCEWAILIDADGVPEVVAVGEVGRVLESRDRAKRLREGISGLADVRAVGEEVVVRMSHGPEAATVGDGGATVYRGRVRSIIVEAGEEISYDIVVQDGEGGNEPVVLERLPARMVYAVDHLQGKAPWKPRQRSASRKPSRQEGQTPFHEAAWPSMVR